ncbi:MAG TPA: serine/threonine-protein kinase, partial [Longimicrobiaceae bacterium]|nr:serine/threonine-protein kinase [Longimicrobiaceae bacterium]
MSGILTLLMGRTLCDRYRIDSVIGAGGMGAVCRAYDAKLEREVAIKVMTAVVPDPGELERLRGRFYREARAAARLRHPNVVTVHDYGTDPSLGIDFLVMELLVGEDLAARMRRAGGPLPVVEALEILREAAMGLAAGHRVGLVHRDVKPGNLYLVAERVGWEVKILDFGIAQMDAPEDGTVTRLTVAAAPHTPRYASPEQLRGETALTPATDVYSLALTGVEMLVGRYPEGVNTDPTDRAAVRALKAVVTGPPELSIGAASVLRRALRIDPAARYPDAGA